MSINQKIVDKISEKTDDDKLKNALFEIINKEIKGMGNYKAIYKEIISESIDYEEE